MKKYGYFLVEGYEDLEVIGKILKNLGITKQRIRDNIDKFWEGMIPTKYPTNPDGDLLKRVEIPVFFESSDYSIAIRHVNDLKDNLKFFDRVEFKLPTIIKKINYLLLFCDADQKNAKKNAIDTYNTLKIAINNYEDLDKEIKKNFASLNSPGEISSGELKTGIYIFPDNNNPGTIEDLLIKCAELNYKELYELALNYRDNAKEIKDGEKFIKEKWGITDSEKALIGSIANILKPGKSTQVSLSDNKWIDNITISDIKEVQSLKQFIENLFR